MTDEKKPLPAGRLIAAAAAFGLIAGAAAVYVKETRSGNGLGAGSATEAAQSDAACPLAAGMASAVAPFLKGQVAAMTPAAAPRKLDGLAFLDPDGKPVTIDNFAGKVLLVNLWATWCVPCREEMPALNGLQKTMGQ